MNTSVMVYALPIGIRPSPYPSTAKPSKANWIGQDRSYSCWTSDSNVSLHLPSIYSREGPCSMRQPPWLSSSSLPLLTVGEFQDGCVIQPLVLSLLICRHVSSKEGK